MQEENFKTQEAVLAFCLDLAECEFIDKNQPCANIFDEGILRKSGYRGELWAIAQEAWRNIERGRVEYIFKQTPRLLELIAAYRDQEAELGKLGGNASTIRLEIAEKFKNGSIQPDEYLLRSACVDLKTRIDFMAIWKKMVPILTFRAPGQSKHFDTTVLSKGKAVKADGVEHPGFYFLSLNASEETRKKMGL